MMVRTEIEKAIHLVNTVKLIGVIQRVNASLKKIHINLDRKILL